MPYARSDYNDLDEREYYRVVFLRLGNYKQEDTLEIYKAIATGFRLGVPVTEVVERIKENTKK